MISYTKGEWKVKENKGMLFFAEKPVYFIECSSTWTALTPKLDDANLIAAAPLMYEALKKAIKRLEYSDPLGFKGNTGDMITKALDKAEGK